MLIIFDQLNPIETFSWAKYQIDEIFVDILDYDKQSDHSRSIISNLVWNIISQIRYLAREIFPEKPKFLIEAYTDAIKAPHGYIFIDNKQGTPPEIRIQTNIIEPIRTVYKMKIF